MDTFDAFNTIDDFPGERCGTCRHLEPDPDYPFFGFGWCDVDHQARAEDDSCEAWEGK